MVKRYQRRHENDIRDNERNLRKSERVKKQSVIRTFDEGLPITVEEARQLHNYHWMEVMEGERRS